MPLVPKLLPLKLRCLGCGQRIDMTEKRVLPEEPIIGISPFTARTRDDHCYGISVGTQTVCGEHGTQDICQGDGDEKGARIHSASRQDVVFTGHPATLYRNPGAHPKAEHF